MILISITLYILYKFRQVRLIAYEKSIIIKGGGWPYFIFNKLEIKASDIKDIIPITFLECQYFNEIDERGYILPGVDGFGKWKGWQAIIASNEGGMAPAIAIITNNTKWIIGVTKPQQTANILQELYNISNNTKTKLPN